MRLSKLKEEEEETEKEKKKNHSVVVVFKFVFCLTEKHGYLCGVESGVTSQPLCTQACRALAITPST